MSENIYTENSIRTFTGKVFDLAIMDPESICIEDIAHGLAYTARWGGHLDGFFSVAQHCCYAWMSARKELQLAALLHDASEAYLGDMPSPFKKLLPDFKMYEDRLMTVIANKFGFEYPLNPEIKHIDRRLLVDEWDCFVEKEIDSLKYWEPEDAKAQFLMMFNETVNNG